MYSNVLAALRSEFLIIDVESSDEFTILLRDEIERSKIKAIIEKALVSSMLLSEYVVAENSENGTEIAILKKGDLAQLGLRLCSLCPAVFNNDAELDVHLKTHFVGFG